ncbi:MAG: molybdenum cofactor guanylyltransferase [Fusobacteriaceae bacterium]|nr:molybdenum cofactor guanylyltransferase [Fusobacteriaceae bacterium]MBP9509939.1 molybdenum cofactor guanylyltransferase [Fusobacteriaceae bacterium]
MIEYKTAIILAGGKGSRLGYIDKAFLKYNGEFFIDILLEKLKEFKEIIIVTNSPEKYSDYEKKYKYINNLKIITDKVKGIGPIGGIYTGLLNSKYNESFIVSCDTPFVNKEFIKYVKELKGDYFIALPVYGEKKEPLCALYKKNIIEIIEKRIGEKKYKIDSIFLNEYTRHIKVNEIFKNDNIIKGFYNINTQEELEKINSKEE